MAAGCVLACRGLGFTAAVAAAVPVAAGCLCLLAAALLARARGRLQVFAGAVALLQMTVFTVLAVVLSYALAARGGPLWDDRLAAADRWLQFDWPVVFRAVDGWPAVIWVGGAAYYSLVAQMVACILVLSAVGHVERLRMAVTAAVLSGALTVAISGVVPAMGNLFDPATYRHLWPSVAWQDRALVAGLRAGSARVLDLSQLSGIVTFPSYHATLPVILAWAQRDVPVLKYAAPVWAGVTILATPLFGGHYAVDVLAGLALALLGIVVASRSAGESRSGLPMQMPNRLKTVYATPVEEGL